MKEVITITQDQFTEAVARTMKQVSENESVKKAGGMAAFLIPLTGMVFTADLRKILFEDDQPEQKKPNEPHESATPDLFGGEYESDL